MKYLTNLLVILTLILLGCNKQTWNEFSCTEGKFSVLLPRMPSKSVQKVNTPIGTYDQQKYTLSPKDEDIVFQIAYTIVPDSLAQLRTPNEHVNSARDWTINAGIGKLISETNIDKDGLQGKRLKFKVTIPSGTSAIITHDIYFIGNILYQLSVVTQVGKDMGVDANKFLNSFKVTNTDITK